MKKNYMGIIISFIVLLTLGLLGIYRPHAMSLTVTRVCAETIFFMLVLFLPGYVVVCRAAPKPLDRDLHCLLAFPATMLMYMMIFCPLYFFSAPRFVYSAIYGIILIYSIIFIGAKVRKDGLPQIPLFLVVTLATSLGVVLIIIAGVNYPWSDIDSKYLATFASHAMPSDNKLQYDTAQVFIKKINPWVWADGYWNWTMGDRPPFLGILTAIISKGFIVWQINYFDYTIIGIILNSLFIFPLLIICDFLCGSKTRSILAVASLIFIPYFFMNIYFTWPKLAGTFFILTGLLIFSNRWFNCFSQIKRFFPYMLCGILFGMGILCHEGSALSIPFILCVAFISRKDISINKFFKSVPVIFVFAFIVYMPWFCYKLAHPEIITKNQLYHYLPYKDLPGNPISISEWLATTPLLEQISFRLKNIKDMLAYNAFPETLMFYITGNISYFLSNRWHIEFFHPVSQIGEIRLLCGAWVILISSCGFFYKKLLGEIIVHREFTRIMQKCLIIIGLAFLSYIGNAFLKRIEICPHALPLTEIVLFVVSVTVLIFSYSKTLTIFLTIISSLVFFNYLVSHSHDSVIAVVFVAVLSYLLGNVLQREIGKKRFPTDLFPKKGVSQRVKV